MRARPKPRQTVSAWANHVGSMLLECLESDAEESAVIVVPQWLNLSYKTGTQTQANTHCSLGTRPRQDYMHAPCHASLAGQTLTPRVSLARETSVMLNDCVSARWSPKYHHLALTSLRNRHPLPTRHIRELRGFSSHLKFLRFIIMQAIAVVHRESMAPRVH